MLVFLMHLSFHTFPSPLFLHPFLLFNTSPLLPSLFSHCINHTTSFTTTLFYQSFLLSLLFCIHLIFLPSNPFLALFQFLIPPLLLFSFLLYFSPSFRFCFHQFLLKLHRYKKSSPTEPSIHPSIISDRI